MRSNAKQRPVYNGPVVIVGNGGSVDAMPPDFWTMDGVEYVGTNRCLVLAACQAVKWSSVLMRDCYRKMFYTLNDNLGWKYHDELWKPSLAYKVGSAHDRVNHCDEFIRQERGWQATYETDHNHEAAVMTNSSVVLMAANWAWICGARELYLIGVDYKMPQHAKMIEPWASYPHGDAKQYDRPTPPALERQFKKAVDAVHELGGTIINLSPGTALKAVPIGKGFNTCITV